MTDPAGPAAGEAGAAAVGPGPGAAPRPGPWRTATVVGLRAETSTARTIRLRLGDPVAYRAGQHFLVRLTAPDGYRASRSYSVASAPDGGREIELTVERLLDGEVSTFLHDDLAEGDTFEVRGPIGGWFVWDGESPALLIGGGSGVVPLMSMLRLARATGREDRLRVVVSARSPEELLFRDELPGPGVEVLYTRRPPAGHPRPAGRISASDLPAAIDGEATVFVCGSAAFAEAATAAVLERGIDPGRIRAERFGPTG